MARRGFLSRVTQAVRRALSPTRSARRAPAPPPPVPPPRTGGGGPPRDDEYAQIWSDETGESPDSEFVEHREVFLSIPGIVTETDRSERLELWESYVRYMVVGIPGMRRNDTSQNPFWGLVGISPKRFDWDDWRLAMGYKRRAS